MCQYLPTGEFKFLPTSQWSLEEILNTPKDADYGYFIECDLTYPESTHDRLNDYPPAPVKKAPENLSPFQTGMITEQIRARFPDITPEALNEKLSKNKTNEKLIADLEEKKNYICHYRLLQKYVELGMEIATVHRVVKFRQKPWMRDYIEFNTEQRGLAKSDFEKEFYKLMNNR